MERRLIRISGIVQGVGFRAFVYRLATELRLTGFVRNEGDVVTAEVEGPPDVLERFSQRLASEPPRRARIDDIDSQSITPTGSNRFDIQPSC
jgi:hydrogenase maturation protein HypF